MDYNINLITTPKQTELDIYQQTLNISMNSSFKDIKRKMKNKSLLQYKYFQKLVDKRFPKKDIPFTMLFVDYIQKKKKKLEKLQYYYKFLIKYLYLFQYQKCSQINQQQHLVWILVMKYHFLNYMLENSKYLVLHILLSLLYYWDWLVLYLEQVEDSLLKL
ncbi:unnamed protein product [Paramecium pentaurelia]|uniref:Transmembrane protein n=1 Tax=Paramecium pentaurelia TaxID=43138 RepID=A0A8S1W815_9CILI|nr:unnamed protein product [Paramecium pentaurelia]